MMPLALQGAAQTQAASCTQCPCCHPPTHPPTHLIPTHVPQPAAVWPIRSRRGSGGGGVGRAAGGSHAEGTQAARSHCAAAEAPAPAHSGVGVGVGAGYGWVGGWYGWIWMWVCMSHTHNTYSMCYACLCGAIWKAHPCAVCRVPCWHFILPSPNASLSHLHSARIAPARNLGGAGARAQRSARCGFPHLHQSKPNAF